MDYINNYYKIPETGRLVKVGGAVHKYYLKLEQSRIHILDQLWKQVYEMLYGEIEYNPDIFKTISPELLIQPYFIPDNYNTSYLYSHHIRSINLKIPKYTFLERLSIHTKLPKIGVKCILPNTQILHDALRYCNYDMHELETEYTQKYQTITDYVQNYVLRKRLIKMTCRHHDY